MDLDFDKLYEPIVSSLKRNGAHPYIRRDWKWFMQFFIMQGLYFVMLLSVIYNMIEHSLKNKNMVRSCGDGTVIVINMVITFKYGVLLVYQENFRILIDLMKENYDHAKTLPVEELNLVIEHARKGQYVTKWWCRLVNWGALIYPAQAIAFTVYSAVKGNFHVVDLYPLHLPKVAKGTLLHFVLVNFIYGFGVFYTTVMYNGMVPLGPVFMLHACGQLALLENRVKTLFPDHSFSSEETNKKIREIAKQLRDIYSFVDNIQTSFQALYDITLKGSALILPLLAFTILQSVNNWRIASENPIPIFIGAIVFSSFPCYYSDKLLEQSQSLRDAFYSCGWETYWDRPSRISLLVILTRTSRPIVMRTMFRVVCLDSLCDVFKEAYSLFSLLLIWYQSRN